MEKFAQVKESFLLKANLWLGDKEFKYYVYVQMEMFNGGGVCRKNIKEIYKEYNFKNYEYLSHIHRKMVDDGWIVETEDGFICAIPTDEELKANLENQSSNFEIQSPKLRNSKSKQAKLPKKGEKTLNFKVDEAPELRNSKSDETEPTLNFKVADFEFQSPDFEIQSSRARAEEDNLNTQENLNTHTPRVRARANSPDQEIPEENRPPESAASFSKKTHPDKEREFWEYVVENLQRLMNSPHSLPNEGIWRQSIDWAWKNEFPAGQAVEVYELLDKIRKKRREKWTIKPSYWEGNIPRIETLRLELADLENPPAAQTNGKGNQGGGYKNNGNKIGQNRGNPARRASQLTDEDIL